MNPHKKLNLVIDTNILLVSIPKQSEYHIIYKSLIEKKYNLFLTNNILKEYEEILHRKYYPDIVEDILNTILYLSNVHFINIYYNWNLISGDPDDNKFVDCSVASNADYLVTNDKHFDILKKINFPKVNIIKIDKLIKLLK